MSDGAKISCMPLVNNLVMFADVPPKVVDIRDCTDHMDVGGKKDTKYLDGVMEEEIFKFDPERMYTIFFYFDESANVQNGTLRLWELYPRAYVFHGGKHVISIFFSDIAKIASIKVRMCAFIFFVSFSTIIFYCLNLKLLQLLILKFFRMYHVFGSDAAYGIYTQFIQKSVVHNNGKRIGLLRGSVTRFATYFYAMMRIVQIQAPLLATNHQAIFSYLGFNECVRSAVMDIENKTLYKALYTLLRSVYPAIQSLRCCYFNVPDMDKIYHLSNPTALSFERSCEMLNDDGLIGPI